jgi:hypothetical protein
MGADLSTLFVADHAVAIPVERPGPQPARVGWPRLEVEQEPIGQWDKARAVRARSRTEQMARSTHGPDTALRAARHLAGAFRADAFALSIDRHVWRIAVTAAATQRTPHATDYISHGSC